eukprot:gene13614-15822_t
MAALRRSLDTDLLAGQRERLHREVEAWALLLVRHRSRGARGGVGGAAWHHLATVFEFILSGVPPPPRWAWVECGDDEEGGARAGGKRGCVQEEEKGVAAAPAAPAKRARRDAPP